jgi:hypothetical protein
MMELLDRYLAAVRRNLPADEAADITEELRDVLLARAEEREAANGDADWPVLLKEFGHPLVVAARYRKHQWLIGPELYPFYVHFMKVVGLIVLAVTVVVATFKAAFGGGDTGAIAIGLLGSLWWAAVASVGSVTILFALIERYGGAERHFRHWNPKQLPDVSAKQPGPWESAFEVGLSVLFLLWWVDLIRLPDFAAGSSFRMEPAPIWNELFWPILALAAARLVYNLLVWLRPRWTVLRGLLGAATAIGGIMILVIVYRAGHWVTVVPTGIDAASAAGLQASLHLAFRIAIIAVGVIWAIGSVGELWRIARSPRS